MSLVDQMPEIIAAFNCNTSGYEEFLDDPIALLDHAEPFDDVNGAEVFGTLLLILSLLSKDETENYRLCMSFFQERLALGYDFSLNPSALKGMSRWTGRGMCSFVKSLMKPQLKALESWEYQVLIGPEGKRLTVDDPNGIRNVLRWIAELQRKS